MVMCENELKTKEKQRKIKIEPQHIPRNHRLFYVNIEQEKRLISLRTLYHCKLGKFSYLSLFFLDELAQNNNSTQL